MFLLCHILMFLLLALIAFYAGSETALTSVNRVWLKSRARDGDRRAKEACHLLENADRFFGTVLVGNNLTHVSLTTLARLAVGSLLTHSLIVHNLTPALAQPDSSWTAWLTSFIVTPIVLVFGEAIPKAFGRSHANSITLLVAQPMRCSERLLAPFVWALGGLARLFSLTPSGEKPLSGRAGVTREDLKLMAEMLAEQHLVGEEAAEMLQMVLELDQRPVETVMVPLIEIQSLPDTATMDDVRKLTAQTGFTHLLVYHERVDRIIGTISLKEVLAQHQPEILSEQEFLLQSVKPYLNRKLLFAPESQSVSTLLDELRHRAVPIAIVVDEYGGMIGMVTAEDLVELITGNLGDERDQANAGFRRLSPTSFLCSGRMEIRVLEEYLGMDIPNQGFETAAGLVLKLAGKIPSAGEHYHYRHVSITVLEVRQHRITKLKFQSMP